MFRGRTGLERGGKLFNAVVDWLKIPTGIEDWQREELKGLVCEAFAMSADDLRTELLTAQKVLTPTQQAVAVMERPNEGGISPMLEKALEEEGELDELVPKKGFFRTYVEYTRNSEAPLAYHVYCALAGMVATVNRRIHFNMGAFRIYPPLGILILGPSGIKKTSAADIMTGILTEMALTPIYAEKLTPEALVDAMKGGNATGLVYAPEMTVLINKQRYMESIIPLLTRFMDSPDVWKSGTIMRGKGELTDVAITTLMCSTLDWFIKNTPETLFGGGFIARNIMVLVDVSPRCIALPQPSSTHLRNQLIIELANLHEFQGEMTMSDKCYQAHLDWYEADKRRPVEHEILETYYQRKPSHLIRFAMCIHLATHHDMVICEECWQTALSILSWTERKLPKLAQSMFKTSWGEDTELVLRKIRSKGGSIPHGDLIRGLQYRMNSQSIRSIVSNLKEAGVVVEIHNTLEHSYNLTGSYAK